MISFASAFTLNPDGAKRGLGGHKNNDQERRGRVKGGHVIGIGACTTVGNIWHTAVIGMPVKVIFIVILFIRIRSTYWVSCIYIFILN